MSYLGRKKVHPKQWMRNELQWNSENYLEYGEINCTKLAEECAEVLVLYGDDFDATIPEEVFDLAVEVVVDFDEGIDYE